MYTDCGIESTHPEDAGLWKAPLPDLSGEATKRLKGLGKYEPWRGWPFRGQKPMAYDPTGGLPADSERRLAKICCQKPTRKCITAPQSLRVAIR